MSRECGFEASACEAQVRLPLRLAGAGLRDSCRIAPAAYWASWADSIDVIKCRYPAIGARILHSLMHNRGTNTLDAARDAAATCNSIRTTFLPTWEELYAGLRPPAPSTDDDNIGERTHGCQYRSLILFSSILS